MVGIVALLPLTLEPIDGGRGGDRCGMQSGYVRLGIKAASKGNRASAAHRRGRGSNRSLRPNSTDRYDAMSRDFGREDPDGRKWLVKRR
jgi:hypothetical protein